MNDLDEVNPEYRCVMKTPKRHNLRAHHCFMTFYQIGCCRYLIVRATFDDDETRYTLRELNAGYPAELLKEIGIE
jgi:hypothetical protein